MSTLGSAFVNIRANLAPLKRGLAMARGVVGTAMKGLSSVVSRGMAVVGNLIRGIMRTIARTVKRAMIVVVAGITAATVAAAKFQNQLAFVSTMLSTNVRSTMDRFGKQITDLAKRFGQGTKLLTKGLFDILSASFSAANAMDILTVATKAAVGGATDVATSVDVITGVLNAYGLEADKATEVSDKLFATVKKGKLEYGDLSTVIGTAGAISKITGVRLEELLAITATATRQNISYQRSSFALVAALNAFLKPQKEAVAVAKKYDVELSVSALKTEGLAKQIRKLSKATEEELATIVGTVRGFKAFAAAMNDLSGFTKDLEFITNGSTGAAAEAYEKMADTASFSFSRIVQRALSMARALGTPLLGPVRKLFDVFSKTMDGIEGFFNDNAETITAWGNSAVDVVGRVIDRTKELFNIAKDEGLTAALKNLFAENIMPGIKAAFDFIRGQLPKVKEVLTTVFDELKPIAVDLGKKIAEGFVDALKDIGRAVAHPFERAAEDVVGIGGVAKEIGSGKIQDVRNVMEGGPVGDFVGERVAEFHGFVEDVAGKITKTLQLERPLNVLGDITSYLKDETMSGLRYIATSRGNRTPHTSRGGFVGPPVPGLQAPTFPSFQVPKVDTQSFGMPRPSIGYMRQEAGSTNRNRMIETLDQIKATRDNTNALKENTRINQEVVGGV